jgi:hypothetical protein
MTGVSRIVFNKTVVVSRPRFGQGGEDDSSGQAGQEGQTQPPRIRAATFHFYSPAVKSGIQDSCQSNLQHSLPMVAGGFGWHVS